MNSNFWIIFELRAQPNCTVGWGLGGRAEGGEGGTGQATQQQRVAGVPRGGGGGRHMACVRPGEVGGGEGLESQPRPARTG